jgi:hypothetical protein
MPIMIWFRVFTVDAHLVPHHTRSQDGRIEWASPVSGGLTMNTHVSLRLSRHTAVNGARLKVRWWLFSHRQARAVVLAPYPPYDCTPPAQSTWAQKRRCRLDLTHRSFSVSCPRALLPRVRAHDSSATNIHVHEPVLVVWCLIALPYSLACLRYCFRSPCR